MKTFPSQKSFSAGEISPLMYGRSDLDIYRHAVRTMHNMFADSRGPARSRPSMKFIEELQDQKVRIESIGSSDNNHALLIFINEALVVVNPTGLVITASTPWTADQLDDLYFIPLPEGNTVYVLHPNVQPHKITVSPGDVVTQEFTTPGTYTFTLPFTPGNVSFCIVGGGGGGAAGRVWNNNVNSIAGGGGGGAGAISGINSFFGGETVSVTVGAGGAGGTSITGGPANGGQDGEDSSFSYFSVSYTARGGKGAPAWDGSAANAQKIYPGEGVDGGGDGGGYVVENNIPTYYGAVACYETCSGRPNNPGNGPTAPGGEILYAGGGGGSGQGGNSSMYSPGGGGSGGGGGGGGGSGQNTAYRGGNGGNGYARFTYSETAPTVSVDPVDFTAAPPDWGGTNWPSCGAHYLNRLYLAADPANPETIYASRVGFPEDFTTGTNPEDAFTATVQRYGKVIWMDYTRVLLVGTENAEYLLTASDNVPKPGDIQLLQQSAYGAADIQPDQVGHQICYVSADGRKVRMMDYDDNKKNWIADDITFPSEHLTQKGVKEIAWAQHPNNLLWLLLNDGTLVGCTFETSTGVFGWHKHDTQGEIQSITSIFDGTESVVYLAVRRFVNGSYKITIERMERQYNLDCWKSAIPEQDTDGKWYADGFDHLNGELVDVIIGTSVHPKRTVGAESSPGAGDGQPGRIWLEEGANICYAGFSFESVLQTLPVDSPDVFNSTSSRKKHRNKIWVYLQNSGPVEINGKTVKDRSVGTPMDASEPFFNEIVKVENMGWNDHGMVTIKSIEPLPLNVLAVFGEMALNSM